MWPGCQDHGSATAQSPIRNAVFMKSYLLIILLFELSCSGQNHKSLTKWESSIRALAFEYESPWSILPTLDTKEKTLTGVIDNRDGKSYIIQITPDASKEELSDVLYFENVKKTMLGANSRNELLEENDTTFHGMSAHSQVYLMYTKKWGLLKQVSFVIRTGVEFVSVQILFPVTKENSSTNSLPIQLVEFDRTVKVEPK